MSAFSFLVDVNPQTKRGRKAAYSSPFRGVFWYLWSVYCIILWIEGEIAMNQQVLEVTAGEIAEKLKHLGIGSDERIRLVVEPDQLTIEPDQELIPGRRTSRANVVAAGLSDSDIDRLIKQAQQEVEPSATS